MERDIARERIDQNFGETGGGGGESFNDRFP